MDMLLLSKQTKKSIELFVQKPSHALLFLGPEGVGKHRLALETAGKVLAIEVDKLPSHPYFTQIVPDGKSISIDAIRNLRTATSLKTLGVGVVRRVIVIVDAQLMTIEAQNALLKTLEEPPADTLLILTAIQDEGLLPTILSRLMVIRVELPGEAESIDYFSKQHPVSAIKTNYLISGGRPGMLASLLAGDQNHPMVQAIADAKMLVASEPFMRMSKVNDLAKDKNSVDLLFDALVLVYRSLLTAAAAKNDRLQLKRIHTVLSDISELQELKAHNPSTKLLLTDLMWRL